MTLDWLINSHRNKGMLIDANLLILFIIGRTNPSLINKFKPTASYTSDDFTLLCRIIPHFTFYSTPHILTETSNLLEKIGSNIVQQIFFTFQNAVTELEEINISATEVVVTPAFKKLGLSDAVIINLAQKGLLVLTEDSQLYSYINNLGATAININHIRGEYFFNN